MEDRNIFIFADNEKDIVFITHATSKETAKFIIRLSVPFGNDYNLTFIGEHNANDVITLDVSNTSKKEINP